MTMTPPYDTPILGIAAASVLLGMLLMLYMVMRFGRGKAAMESS